MSLTIFMLILVFVLSMTLSGAVLILANFLSMKTFSDLEKTAPFECGFIPQSNFRMPFSMHFFLIAIVFLIFDIELVVLFPYFLKMEIGLVSPELFFLVIILLTLGTLVEWSQTMLDWVNF